METFSVSEFKAKCLAIIERIVRTGEAVIVTKNGEAAVEVRRAGPKPRAAFGFARGEVTVLGDIVSPTTEDLWESLPE